MNWQIDVKLFFKFAIAFILMVVTGTLHHESGHHVAGKVVGIDSRINYCSTKRTTEGPAMAELMAYLGSLHLNMDDSSAEYRSKTFKHLYQSNTTYRELFNKAGREDNFVRIGGPLMTMITGTIGLILLLWSLKSANKKELKVKHYLLVFMSLLWLRQPMNLAMGIVHQILNGFRTYRDDESRIAFYYDQNPWLILVITGIIGFAIASYVIFRVIPLKERLTFILAGFVGGGLGYYLWLVKLGPIILP